jgi:hypothetical protein
VSNDAQQFALAFKTMGQRLEVLNANLGILDFDTKVHTQELRVNTRAILRLCDLLEGQGKAKNALQSAAGLAQVLREFGR